jgi:hypothetical protein
MRSKENTAERMGLDAKMDKKGRKQAACLLLSASLKSNRRTWLGLAQLRASPEHLEWSMSFFKKVST